MKELSLSKVYQLLQPSPVVLLTTARNGRANVMIMFRRHADFARSPQGDG